MEQYINHLAYYLCLYVGIPWCVHIRSGCCWRKTAERRHGFVSHSQRVLSSGD